LKSQKFLAAIHLVDSKRHDINLPVAPEALLVEQTVTKAAARLHSTHQRSESPADGSVVTLTWAQAQG
jgi:hypothetical protein